MRKFLIVAALAAALIVPATALASGSAPTAPSAAISGKTQTSLSLAITALATDPDNDISYYEFQLNGVFYSAVVITQVGQGQTYTGLSCGTGYTVRVRAVDSQGHHGPFATVTGSQGAVTLPCGSITAR